ncbi:N-alpha-acetyltransferase 80-like [Saccostrea echinata]|uniref:N-alpha-acetyltransferase 80-like n=1 Tax=Saccostrea echinata TaxID=191078 RepID=UPI002A83CA57|nr:N-alpha-acetyltransferase 80-like [Saccostrea echinata]XP_061166830.1 N-alpha-acetyltransferase 80-like [Saccostrea echinata]
MEKLLVLHENKEYFNECANILNEEWKRSTNARLHSLQKSCDSFPTCLIIVGDFDGVKNVVAHSRLSKVQGKPNSCLVESVVVRKSLRGKGYGRKIMLETEQFAKSKGLATIYLSTHDKQDFYKHLGYTFCDPIVCFGVNTDILPEGFLQKFLPDITAERDSSSGSVNTSIPPSGSPVVPPSAAPPPPPPPPPPTGTTQKDRPDIVRWDPSAISWMKKDL